MLIYMKLAVLHSIEFREHCILFVQGNVPNSCTRAYKLKLFFFLSVLWISFCVQKFQCFAQGSRTWKTGSVMEEPRDVIKLATQINRAEFPQQTVAQECPLYMIKFS
jgi:hypothetical protein